MDNLQIPLNLTLSEVNVVLAHLGKGPFDQVFTLVTKIQQQAQPAIAKAQAEANAEAAKASAPPAPLATALDPAAKADRRSRRAAKDAAMAAASNGYASTGI